MMEKVAVITGADRGLGLALCKEFLLRGWKVFAGQFMPEWKELSELTSLFSGKLILFPLDVSSDDSVKAAAQLVIAQADHVDLLINNTGIIFNEGDIRKGLNYDLPMKMYQINSLGPIRMVEAFLPLMEKGMKRLCFVSSEAGSIGACKRKSEYGYCMSKAALNMAVRILFNELSPEGFTFRLYHPGWLRSYMLGEKNLKAAMEPEDSARFAYGDFVEARAEENRLVLMDNEGREWPW